MYKRIELNKNRILILDIEKENHLNMITISEYFGENGTLKKNYSLSIWDDFSFNAYSPNMEGLSELSFQIDNDHPLYNPFIKLLKGDKELIIDDDGTREDNKKYLKIYVEDNSIILLYVNILEKKSLIASDIFNVFIKNIMFDGRSKIDRQEKDTKKRLINFFGESSSLLLSDTKEKTKTLK